MRPRIAIAFSLILSSAALAACEPAGGDDGDGDSTSPPFHWFLTCGDPACSGYTPKEGVALCSDQTEGVPCGEEGLECDPKDDCNALLRCAEEDPKEQEGGCPISRRSAKRDVAYLDPVEAAEVEAALMRLPLATWSYTWDPAGRAPRLGFVLEDAPGSPAVDAARGRVDLYGYTSMAVAALQSQRREIEGLEAALGAQRVEIEDLRDALESLRAEIARARPAP